MDDCDSVTVLSVKKIGVQLETTKTKGCHQKEG
jgi:hypothetical protein